MNIPYFRQSHMIQWLTGSILSNSMIHETGVARTSLLCSGPTIVIPLIHPGYTRTKQGFAQYEVFWLSWLSVWIHIDTALNILQTHGSYPANREGLCQKIVNDTREKLQTAGFYSYFTKVKRTMAADIPEFAQDISSIDSAWARPSDRTALASSNVWTKSELDILEEMTSLQKSNEEIALVSSFLVQRIRRTLITSSVSIVR
jgi:hypothetical protein